ncbi:MAG: hypothetical protein ABSD71_04175 [Bacteroidales bacterium]
MKTINLTRAIIIIFLAGFISSFSSYAAGPAAAASARGTSGKSLLKQCRTLKI